MPRALCEITATVARERRRFGESEPFTVITEATLCNGSILQEADGQPSHDEASGVVLKGKTEGGGESGQPEEPQQHLTYRFYGRWSNYTNPYTGQTERQFLFDTFVRAAPHSRAGVVKYLDGAPGIGRAFACRLWEKFGADAVRVLRERPEVAAAAVRGLSEAAAGEAAAWLEREKALEDCTIELVGLLEGRGFPKAVVKQAVKEFGNRAAQVIRDSPYKIMRFRGCGFKRADALYLDLGLPPHKLKRQALCAWHHVARNTDGDTWHYRATVDVGLAGAIAGADVRTNQAVELATRGGLLATMRTKGLDGPIDWDGDFMWVAEATKARNESRLAAFVVEALSESTAWPDLELIRGSVSGHQFEHLHAATLSPLGILGGSPGTGKTYTAAQLIRVLGESLGFAQIAAAAPTGKAAVRLTEAMQAYGIPLVARTIHSLLKVESNSDGGGWSFAFNRGNPLPFKALVVDEASMIDTDLAASLFAARSRGTLVLIIGDVNQLPPVGHGAPLRDMIAAGVPYGELREIRRNDGGIVQACADIRDKRPFKCDGNLRLVEARTAAKQREDMVRIVDESARAFGVDPVWGVQVLCALNKKSELSRRELNKILQNHLNPNQAIKGSPFRLRDKVVNTRNSWLPLVDVISRNGKGRVELADNDENLELNKDGKVYVANGELGEVVKVEHGYLHVRLSAPKRLVVVPRGKQDAGSENDKDAAGDENGNVDEATSTGCDWDLGFALSVHKSQGSEWPVVVYMVDENARRLCTREHVYTGISRAKQCCYLVGKLAAAHGFCSRTAIDRRRTFLRQQIEMGMKRDGF